MYYVCMLFCLTMWLSFATARLSAPYNLSNSISQLFRHETQYSKLQYWNKFWIKFMNNVTNFKLLCHISIYSKYSYVNISQTDSFRLSRLPTRKLGSNSQNWLWFFGHFCRSRTIIRPFDQIGFCLSSCGFICKLIGNNQNQLHFDKNIIEVRPQWPNKAGSDYHSYNKAAGT